MTILYPPTLLSALKDKHLLLDTNVFIDSVGKPTDYKDFFDTLKRTDIALTTIDFVKYEILKGSADLTKYKDREKLINEIIDVALPTGPQIFPQVYELIKKYGISGIQLSMTDLLLGATLMQYKRNIYLMTRDTSDFIQSVFHLAFVVNAPHSKGIFTYGIYQYIG